VVRATKKPGFQLLRVYKYIYIICVCVCVCVCTGAAAAAAAIDRGGRDKHRRSSAAVHYNNRYTYVCGKKSLFFQKPTVSYDNDNNDNNISVGLVVLMF